MMRSSHECCGTGLSGINIAQTVDVVNADLESERYVFYCVSMVRREKSARKKRIICVVESSELFLLTIWRT